MEPPRFLEEDKVEPQEFYPDAGTPPFSDGDGRRSGRDSAPRNPAVKGAADLKSSGLHARNGQSWELDGVPVLEEGLFRRKILEGCSQGARLVNLFACAQDKGGDVRIFAMLGKDQEGKLPVFCTRVPAARASFRSLTPELPQAHMFEREIAEQFAVTPAGHPWLKPVRYHRNYRDVPDLWPEVAAMPVPGVYPFYRVEGEEAHEVAVGPVHAGIIEPGHFRFQCHGEEVLNLEVQLGYQHRGIEKMMAEVSSERAVLLAESIAGDTVIAHATAYCTILESLGDREISPRAQAIRAVALELERLSNHAGDLGALSTDIGFSPPAAYFGRLRGEFLNLLMELSGNRYGRSLCRPGGVLFDLDQKMAEDFRGRLLTARKDLKEISDLFFGSSSVLSRIEGTGIVSNQAARELGLVGPAARASGAGVDVRTDYAFGMYRFHHIPISTVAAGDVYARALVRWLESQRSLEFLLDILNRIPEGELCVKIPALKPDHMALAMVEGWRGEVVHVAMTDSRCGIARYKIKDPSFHNWSGLAMAVRGGQISDFPLCNKSFNLSYAGHDL
ncbi:MAG: NADH-quinone oxidoreductase subunit C [Candidatus Omnitrophica bacterium]|nr:NADH-quinone oxidoreductase subunit C [Candidatus Omnitrophota bacterium]